MALIPVFKKANRDELMENWNLEFPLSEWVAIQLPFNKVKKLDKELDLADFKSGDKVEYETNRYDVVFEDLLEGKKISVYFYMDEDSSTIIAIDSIVQDVDENVRYQVKETPFWDVITSLAG